MSNASPTALRVSAIVPARNEERVIAACVESLARQEEVGEVLVVDDQSTDRTAEIVRGLMQKHLQTRLIEAGELPAGWVGKNHAMWRGAGEARGEWLLFADADAVHEKDSAERALGIAAENDAAMVSFSPEQVMEKWYEKALIPYVYCRLGAHFSFREVNDPSSRAAAANGQFLMIRRETYDEVGGHASVAGEVLEDVALAKKVKGAGGRIWFGSGKGVVRVRMYRSFGAMWEGWKKNLYPLMGGTRETMVREFARAVVPVAGLLILAITVWAWSDRWLNALALFLAGVVGIFVWYDGELRRNGFAPRLLWWGIAGRVLFGAVLLASNWGYRRGKLGWKGREYPVGSAGASNRQL
jgi:cellulose synthase/poly-beta-1,6-N-acetylglucosamine synthase-like glycosyltransferase